MGLSFFSSLLQCPLNLSALIQPPSAKDHNVQLPLNLFAERDHFWLNKSQERFVDLLHMKSVLELLRNSLDKRALRVCKKKLGTHKRAKAKVEELGRFARAAQN